MKKRLLFTLAAQLLVAATSFAQFADCSTGLLQMPTAEMQEDGTFMITNNYLNRNALSSRIWDYGTFQYAVSISFWERIELSYICTILNGAWSPKPNKTTRQAIMRNQDRHFSGRVQLLREGEFGIAWMPALVVGISDPTTGGRGWEYFTADVSASGNAFFNRNFAVISKHLSTTWGQLGLHAGYQFNRRKDYSINGPCAGIAWRPTWLQDLWILDGVDLIVEYDSRTPNMGFIASLWDNRFEAMFECQNFRWINFGLRYKLRLRKV